MVASEELGDAEDLPAAADAASDSEVAAPDAGLIPTQDTSMSLVADSGDTVVG